MAIRNDHPVGHLCNIPREITRMLSNKITDEILDSYIHINIGVFVNVYIEEVDALYLYIEIPTILNSYTNTLLLYHKSINNYIAQIESKLDALIVKDIVRINKQVPFDRYRHMSVLEWCYNDKQENISLTGVGIVVTFEFAIKIFQKYLIILRKYRDEHAANQSS